MKWSIPERIIEKGRRYVKEGRVLSVSADKEQKVWHAQVMGHELYLVDLDGTAKEQDTCQCLFWQEKGFCKHTVAVELYLREQGINRIMQQDQVPKLPELSLSQLFTQGLLENFLKKSVTTETIQMTYQIENQEMNPFHKERSLLSVSLKIGYVGQRQYLIKNIGEFLQQFRKEEKILLNGRYVFYLSRENFTKEDLKVLDLLNMILESQQSLYSSGFVRQGKLEKKQLLLPLNGLLETLEKLFATKRAVLLLEGRYTTFSYSKEKALTADLSFNEENFSLDIQDPLSHYYTNYHLGFSKGTWYEFSPEEETIYLTLEQLLKHAKGEAIVFPKEDVSKLFSQILPIIKQVAKVNLPKDLPDHLVLSPLETVFHLRKIKGEIRVEIDFHYGKAMISSNQEKNQLLEQPIVRDIEGENEVYALLKSLSYVEKTKDFRKKLPQGQGLYQFFTQEIPLMQNLGKVYLGKKLRALFIEQGKTPPKVAVTSEDSWLSVRFDVSGVPEEEIAQVVAAILKKEPYYETNSGAILDLNEEEFGQTAETLQQLRGKWDEDGKLQIPNYQGLQLQNVLSLNDHLKWDEKFHEMANDLTHPENFKASLPKNLQATLRDYQKQGFTWWKMLSHYELGGILADEMGLGKTLQGIAFLLSQKEEKIFTHPSLVVAPASLTYNWQSECEKFAPSLKVGLAVGSKEEREKIISQAEEYDLLITSYTSLRQDEETYRKETFSCLILDEAQMVKNDSTKTNHALRKLKVRQRFALSGTPIENNLMELWSLFGVIMPGFFPKKQAYKQLPVETISKMIQPFVLRREKETVLKELPEKIETNLYSSLLPEQKAAYLAYLSQMQQNVSSMDQKSFAKNRLSILAGLTRLRQICCDPRMFMEDFTGHSGKLEQLKEFLLSAKENGRRVLVFSQFTKMLSLIEEELPELGLDHFYLRGSTPPKDRLKMVDEFNAGTGDVFLISLKAGGTGLNLTGADTVVLYDLWWNPAVEEQAAGRAHRIGQKKVVEVYKMIAKGTIEEKMAALQQEKRELFHQVLSGNQESSAKLTEEDIRYILSVGE